MSNAPHAQSLATSTPGFILFTTPIYLANLGFEDRNCPICQDEYIEPQMERPEIDNIGEWALRVDISATEEKSTACCRHVFGRWCLEKHVNSQAPWYNRCPLCRMEWWVTPRLADTSPESIQGVGAGEDGRQGGHSTPGEARAPQTSIVQQVLNEFAIEGESDRINATVQEVSRRLGFIFQQRVAADDVRQALLSPSGQSGPTHLGT